MTVWRGRRGTPASPEGAPWLYARRRTVEIAALRLGIDLRTSCNHTADKFADVLVAPGRPIEAVQ